MTPAAVQNRQMPPPTVSGETACGGEVLSRSTHLGSPLRWRWRPDEYTGPGTATGDRGRGKALWRRRPTLSGVTAPGSGETPRGWTARRAGPRKGVSGPARARRFCAAQRTLAGEDRSARWERKERAAALVPPSAGENPERDQCCESQFTGLINTTQFCGGFSSSIPIASPRSNMFDSCASHGVKTPASPAQTSLTSTRTSLPRFDGGDPSVISTQYIQTAAEPIPAASSIRPVRFLTKSLSRKWENHWASIARTISGDAAFHSRRLSKSRRAFSCVA